MRGIAEQETRPVHDTLLDGVEIDPGPQATHSVVWLHGLGADGHDFEPIVPELRLTMPVRFVFPHAPVRPITINGGVPMRAWFDILSFERGGAEDVQAIRESADAVRALLDREIERGIPSQQIVLAGFSQGGALALHLALREKRPLAGIMALSAFLPLAETLDGEKSPVNASTPIFWAHGLSDPIIDLEFARLSIARLQDCGYLPEVRTYPMGHGVCAEEVRDIAAWLTRVLTLPKP
jgi:phospholipase/carboxylesterase